MANELIVSVSGIRGIVGAGLPRPTAALAFAQALGTYLGGGRIVLSRDSRPSGAMLRHAVVAGLTACGCEVHDLGIAPTPTVGLAVRKLEAAGAIQITASHNPAPWNGLKLFGVRRRRAFRGQGHADQADFRRRLVHARQPRQTRPHARMPERRGLASRARAATWWTCRSSVRATSACCWMPTAAPAGRSARRCSNRCTPGRSCKGAIRTAISPIRPSRSPRTWQRSCRWCRQHQARVGFVLDPDADRLAIIDEQGRYIGEELTLALAVLCRLKQERGPIVINMSSSRVDRGHRETVRRRVPSVGGRRGERRRKDALQSAR